MGFPGYSPLKCDWGQIPTGSCSGTFRLVSDHITVTHLDLCWAFRKVEEPILGKQSKVSQWLLILVFTCAARLCICHLCFDSDAWAVKIHSLFLCVFKYWYLVSCFCFIFIWSKCLSKHKTWYSIKAVSQQKPMRILFGRFDIMCFSALFYKELASLMCPALACSFFTISANLKISKPKRTKHVLPSLKKTKKKQNFSGIV